MSKLFTVESQSAGEGLTPPGPWTPPLGEAKTLAEARAMVVAENAKGWRYARVVASCDMAEALRVESETLRTELQKACRHPVSIDTMPSFCGIYGKQLP